LAVYFLSILYTLRALVALLAEVGERYRFKLAFKCVTPREPLKSLINLIPQSLCAASQSFP
jgi:hypothetical protein